MLLKEMLVSKNNELSDVIKSLDDEAMAQRPDGICVSRKDVTELQETINKKREVCDKVKLEIPPSPPALGLECQSSIRGLRAIFHRS